ncbi:MAG: hypothetical protein MJ188_04370 [Treponema sp.]|nr:hypothetical protein [Treponema sp.]
MNHIPSIFNQRQINRTLVGGRKNESPDALNISVILLNHSGSHFKLHVFENLLACNFQSIISIENDVTNFSIDEVSRRFPAIKFVIPLEKATDGEMINLAMSEITSDYVLVLRDDLYIPSGFILSNLAERLTAENVYCVVPRLMDKNKNGLSTHFSPGAEKSHFVIDSSFVVKDGVRTLYPSNYIALYNRKKFIKLGGFDYTIKSPYWQNLDLAIRSWLFGEETKLTTMLQFSYLEDAPVEDKTINMDYLKYYLKNEMPVYKNEGAFIKSSAFFNFYRHSCCGYIEARRQFNQAKNWIEKNKSEYKMDLQTLIQTWDQYEK